MAELRDILASGDITDLQLDDITVRDLLIVLREWRLDILATGIDVPELPSASAGLNALFVNTDGTTDRLCFKDSNGDVVRIRTQAI